MRARSSTCSWSARLAFSRSRKRPTPRSMHALEVGGDLLFEDRPVDPHLLAQRRHLVLAGGALEVVEERLELGLGVQQSPLRR